MVVRVRRSIASALRVSLISACGALGWLALSATAATADDGGESNLLGTISSVVEPLTATTQSSIQNATSPVAAAVEAVVPAAILGSEVPKLRELPDIVGNLDASETVATVTGLVDSTLSQVPVVNRILPSDPTTAVTQPVLETVDLAVAPILPPVQQVLTPVVDAVEPVAKPVSGVVDPGLTPTFPDAAPPVPAVSGDPVPPSATAIDSVESSPAAVEPAVSPSGHAGSWLASLPTPKTLSGSYHSGSYLQSEQSMMRAGPQPGSPAPQPTGDPLGVPGTPPATGTASAGSLVSAGTSAADAPFLLSFNPSAAGSPQPGYSPALPQGPTFEPGSTPD